jgi:hypothetical protein
MRFWVYKLEEKGPKLVREIPLSEVLGDWYMVKQTTK